VAGVVFDVISSASLTIKDSDIYSTITNADGGDMLNNISQASVVGGVVATAAGAVSMQGLKVHVNIRGDDGFGGVIACPSGDVTLRDIQVSGYLSNGRGSSGSCRAAGGVIGDFTAAAGRVLSLDMENISFQGV